MPITSNDLEEILKKENWEIVYYDLSSGESVDLLKNFKVFDYAQNHDGFSLKSNSLQIVFIRNKLSSKNNTFILAHELGHIKAGHFSDTGILGKHSNLIYDDQQEAEANAFARHLLAPECILKQIGLKTVDEVESHTLLEGDVLKTHYTDYKMYKKKTTSEEEMLIGNFTNYIKEHAKKYKAKNVIIFSMVVILACIFGIGIYSLINKSNIGLDNEKSLIPGVVLESNITPDITTQDIIQKPITVHETQKKIKINGNEYSTDMTVYKTKTGTKFHKEDCKHLVNRNGVSAIILKNAVAVLQACDDCF